MLTNNIDITFDVRNDSKGRDSDSSSKMLRYYHKLLWNKSLPNSKLLQLDDSLNGVYLYHKSEMGEYFLTSDSIIHTYFKWKRMQNIIKQIPISDIKLFYNLAHTIGGYVIFPGNKINGLNTINQERGINKRINDRIDLTMECIRRFYINQNSPLFNTFKRYSNFFALFSDFKGYCDFFLLQDLVNYDYSKINYFLPFNDFVLNPLPNNSDEYNLFKNNSISFLHKRNKRINEFAKISK